MSKTIPRKIEFCVVSAGGVATTQLLTHFESRHCVNCHQDADNLKHLPIPAVSFNPAFRYIYVFGDPVPSVISLFRRGFYVLQARKLQRGYPGPPLPRMPIREYAAGGRDLFGFERHFDNYYERHLIHPTLFVRYDALWENLDRIRDFLGLGADEFANFAQRSRRKSDDHAPCRHVMRQLQAIYKPFNDRLAALPDAFVRGEHLARRRGHLFLSTNLRMAAMNALKAKLRPAGALYGE
jgi:hypothetical protein